MPLVVSDSSTLMHLAALERLTLLRDFFGQVVVPPAVWHEVVTEGKGRPGAAEVSQARQSGWLAIETPVDQALLQLLRRELNDGEAEAIAVAVERQADLIPVDETEARRVADLYGLPKTGVIGVLMRAKREASGRRPDVCSARRVGVGI